MVLFNYATKEITAKIVYYGPGLCGKTTNLQFVYDSLPSSNRSKMLSLATQTDRTLFFDFLPIDLGTIRGMRTRLQLYTVPGQVFYNSTRQLVLRGADGVVFVADSQDSAFDANIESLRNLEENLKRQGIRISEIPLVMQYNKRDLPNAMPVQKMNEAINQLGVPSFRSVATTGEGVEATLNGIAAIVLKHLNARYGLQAGSEEDDLQVLGTAGAEAPSEETVWAEPEPESEPEADLSEPIAVASLPEQYEAPSLLDLGASTDDPFQTDSTDLEMEIGLAVEEPMPEVFSVEALAGPAPQSPPPTDGLAEDQAESGLVREVTLPLNLTLDELQRHRKLKVRITLEVNLLK